MDQRREKGKRVVKNTLILYFRLLFTMVVSLYTSRIVLRELGVTDYGVYNVVGGLVGLFTVISGSLTNAISRFITFELGRDDLEKLKKVFSTSILIQLLLGIGVIIIGEGIGLWFLNSKLNIPDNRLFAANIVFQCSILSFIINLLSVPYNADIIAHEKMSAFAYISILEVSLKLAIVYLLIIIPGDKLIVYATLVVVTSLIVRFAYVIYCKKRFEETHYKFIWESRFIKDILSFAGWNFLGNGAYVLNNQGVNLLINLFFGVVMNTARGIAVQAESALMGFVNNFSLALTPQIVKSYASKDFGYMFRLINSGTKFTAYIMLYFTIPCVIEAKSVLSLWLGEVPPDSVEFLQYVLVTMFICNIGNFLYTGILATGDIRNYQILVSSLAVLVFPFTWVAYKIGFSVVSTYVIYSFIYFSLNYIRVRVLKKRLGYNPVSFLKEALCPILYVSVTSVLPIVMLDYILPQSTLRFFIIVLAGILTVTISVYFLGLNKKEKEFIFEKISTKFYSILK